MEHSDFMEIVSKRKKVIWIALLLFLAVATIVTFKEPLKYSAVSRLQIIENNGTNNPIDPYVAAKNNAYITDLLARVTTSGAFYQEVTKSGFDYDQSYFTGNSTEQLVKWKGTAEVQSTGDSGILNITIYHANKAQAVLLNKAVSTTLKEKNGQFHSSGSKIELRILDEPIVSRFPVKPNVLLNYGLAVVLGISFGLFYIYVFSYPIDKYVSKAKLHRRATDLRRASDYQPVINQQNQQIYNTQPKVYSEPVQPASNNQSISQPRPADKPAVGQGNMKNLLG